ncbi:MAG: pyridoxal-dependent decarboxylase [Pseudomonadota bacterium]
MATDDAFRWHAALLRAVELMNLPLSTAASLPTELPEIGMGGAETLERLAPHVLGNAARLDDPLALAHMDPPTPWVAWAMALWNARLNQNLLHPATSPFARDAERIVLDWLAPIYGMTGGHFCGGSSLANLTALWVARDAAGAESIVASEAAHVSIRKAAGILGLPYRVTPVNAENQLEVTQLGDISRACLVLTAGTTVTGSLDSLAIAGQAAWTHVDAAWAGALQLTDHHADLLNGIEAADSVALSAHKWLFQPKDSALVLFRDAASATDATSVSGSYLATPNVGIQGSRSAAAVPLLATLLALGRSGLCAAIESNLLSAKRLADAVDSHPQLELWRRPTTGITVFRPVNESVDALLSRLPVGMLSTGAVAGRTWLRSVAANPLADIDAIVDALHNSLGQTQ